MASRRHSPAATYAQTGWATVLFATVLGLASSAWPADYKQEEFDKRTKNSQRYTVSRILAGETPLSANEEAFTNYFGQVFAEMTRLENLGQIAELRWSLYRQVRDTKDPAALSRFNQLTLERLQNVCREDYHPAARYNAALILGDLDQELSTGYNPATKPVPLPEVVPVLLGFLSDDQMIDAVKVAALVGLERHARYDLPAPARQSVSEAMLALLRAKEPPKHRFSAGHDWMRRQAVGVLGTIGDLGADSLVFRELVAVLADDDAPVTLRCAAADAVSRLKYGANTRVDAGGLVGQLGNLALVTLQHELALADRLRDQVARETDSGGVVPAGSATSATPDKPDGEGIFPRRQLAERIVCVRQGLDTIKAQADPQPKAQADQIIEKLDRVVQLVGDDQLGDDTLLAEVAKLRGELEAAVRPPQGAAPASVEPPKGQQQT